MCFFYYCHVVFVFWCWGSYMPAGLTRGKTLWLKDPFPKELILKQPEVCKAEFHGQAYLYFRDVIFKSCPA